MRCPLCGQKLECKDIDITGNYQCPKCRWVERVGKDNKCALCDPVKNPQCNLCIGS
jgi:hypothetical protein